MNERRCSRSTAVLVCTLFAAFAMGIGGADRVAAAVAPLSGVGSSHSAIAMQHIAAEAADAGIGFDFLPTGSEPGLVDYGAGLADFATSEVEYRWVGDGSEPERGRQYVPLFGTATGLVYNLTNANGTRVDDLRLSSATVARIFMGAITSWSDPAITADNDGRTLADIPITVGYRAGTSAVHAVVYELAKQIEPTLFETWSNANGFSPSGPILDLSSSPGFAPRTAAFNGTDQLAQYVSSPASVGTIAAVEYAYGQVYSVPTAAVGNATGSWTHPDGPAITAALRSARLRPDTSPDLRGVPTSTDPAAYPLSYYGFMVVPCAVDDAVTDCRGAYPDEDKTATMAEVLRIVACDAQRDIAAIGYATLPGNLAQEVAVAISRLTSEPAETLTPDNCANPSLGEGAASIADSMMARGVQGSERTATAVQPRFAG